MSKKKWKVTLTPISPIHIGDGEILDPTEYIAKDDYVYYLNQIPYITHLLGKGNNALKSALDSADMQSIIQIMADNFDAENKQHWKSRTKVDANFCNRWQQNLKNIRNSQQLHRFIRNKYNDMPYIPGSSIKGAIRTAILDHLAKDENKSQNIEQAKRDRKFKAQTAEAILLDAQNKWGSMDVASDPFKYLKVSDAVLKDEDLFIDKILRYGMSDTELPVYYEMISPKEQCFVFQITADQIFMKKVINIINRLNMFYKELVDRECIWLIANVKEESAGFRKNLIEKANATKTAENNCLIRLGFGTGHWGMTLHQYWKENVKTKALWNDQLMGWAVLHFKEIT